MGKDNYQELQANCLKFEKSYLLERIEKIEYSTYIINLLLDSNEQAKKSFKNFRGNTPPIDINYYTYKNKYFNSSEREDGILIEFNIKKDTIKVTDTRELKGETFYYNNSAQFNELIRDINWQLKMKVKEGEKIIKELKERTNEIDTKLKFIKNDSTSIEEMVQLPDKIKKTGWGDQKQMIQAELKKKKYKKGVPFTKKLITQVQNAIKKKNKVEISPGNIRKVANEAGYKKSSY